MNFLYLISYDISKSGWEIILSFIIIFNSLLIIRFDLLTNNFNDTLYYLKCILHLREVISSTK